MANGDFLVFVSAVSSEFENARSAVASDLRSRGLSVKVQEDFRQEANADTLLSKLHNYIRNCSAVVCIIGDRSGARPTSAEAEPLLQLLPPGITQASYTQWEFFLARHYQRRLSLYIAKDYESDQSVPTTDDPKLQTDYLQTIENLGLDREFFGTNDELRWRILRQDWISSRQPKPIVLPYPSIGDLFKGRVEFLQALNENLRRGGHTAIVSQALYGLGGIGKTRAAVEYAWAHQDEYTALLFVVAETPESLRRNMAALASTLVPKLDTTDDVARLHAVRDWLKINPGWFLILDNVDARPAQAEVERQLSGLSGGHVVVTSRLKDFSGSFRPLELGLLAIDDAVAFLLARTEGRHRSAANDDAKAREIAMELGRLALALEQAAAFIARRELTFDQYLKQWHSHADKILAWFDETITGYPRAVAVTWQTSITQLSENGRRLLQRLAWLAPEKVPESLLDTPIPGAESENLHDALDDLAAYSLITRDAEGPYFLVHRLVQDVSRRSLADEVRRQRLEEALGWISAGFTGDAQDVRAWPKLDPIAPHARTVAEYADAAGISQPASLLMNILCVLLVTKALYADAEPIGRRTLAIDEQIFGSDHPAVAISSSNLAQLLKATNRLAEAESLIRRALAIDEKSYGFEHPRVAGDLNNLARLLHDTNRLDEAEPLMRRALAIDEKSFGTDHPRIAIGLNNLAGLLQNTSRLEEAEPLIRRALVIDERSFGPDHPVVAVCLNNLAQLLKANNRLTDAEPLMRRALAIDEKNFGLNHPKVAIRLSNLARLLHDTARQSEAEPLMRRALTIDEKSFGPNHPDVAIDLNNLAGLLQETGRLAEAEPLIRRALAIDEMSFGPNHPIVAIRLNNLAHLLKATNRIAEAEPLMFRHVSIFVDFTRTTKYPHPHLEAAFRNYVDLLTEMGKNPIEIEAAVNTLMRALSS
jgi:tetratricopeptide (TPR) repeat protein